MNTNEEDKKLAQVLKQGAHDPGENPWFTRRVLNKLPEKREKGTSWSSVAIYAIALVACVICWLLMWHGQNWDVITVRDVLYNVMMGGVTFTVLWQAINSLIQAADV
ncbi:MAG: hypothetical protein IKZ92_09675 [Muribaculaceae bacterium]|nr:hypothetical protein [Muribaculaceae bacterium]